MRSITNKIALWLILALFVSFFAISAVSYFTAQDRIIKLVGQTQDKILQDVKIVVDTFFSDYSDTVASLANHLEAKQLETNEILYDLKDAKEWGGDLLTVVYFGREKDGEMIYSNGKISMPDSGYDPRARGWYKSAKAQNSTIYTEPYVSVDNNQFVVSFAAPVKKDSALAGVASMNVNVESISKKIIDIGKTEYGYVFVMNKDGAVLIHEDNSIIGKSVEATTLLSSKFKNKDHDENGLYSYTNYKGESVTAKILQINNEGWLAIAAIGANTFSDNTMPILKTQIILAIIFIAVLSAFVYFLLKRSLSPVKTIQEGLEAVFAFVTHEAKAPNKLTINTNDEFSQMSDNINKNIDKVIGGIQKDSAMIDELNNVANLMINGNSRVQILSGSNNPALVEFKKLLNTFFISISSNLKDVIGILNQYGKNDFAAKMELPNGIESNLRGMMLGVKNMGSEVVKMLNTNLDQAQSIQEKAKVLSDL